MLHQSIDTATQAAEPIAPERAADCRKEMGATPAEFLRQLRTLAPSGDIRIDETRQRARIVHGSGMVTIDYQPRPDRRTGALTLPVTGVEIRFQDLSLAQAADFLAVWDRNFLRMGG